MGCTDAVVLGRGDFLVEVLETLVEAEGVALGELGLHDGVEELGARQSVHN